MDIQTQIENAVTNKRGYSRTGSGFGKSETDSDAALQARLVEMGDEKAYSMFYIMGRYNQVPYNPLNELIQLDKDLRNLGLKDKITTPEQVEQALKIKRYLVGLVKDVANQAFIQRDNPLFTERADDLFRTPYLDEINKCENLPRFRFVKERDYYPKIEKIKKFIKINESSNEDIIPYKKH